jgi:hypothetical protein
LWRSQHRVIFNSRTARGQIKAALAYALSPTETARNEKSKIPVDFRTMLNPVDSDKFPIVINPVKNPIIADPQFAQSA